MADWSAEAPSEDLIQMVMSEDAGVDPTTPLAERQTDPATHWTPVHIRQAVHSTIALEQAGKLLEQARAHRGLTTRELAEKVGVSQPRVVQVQSAGESLNLGTLVKFALAMGYRVRLELVPEEGGEILRTR